MKTMWIVSAVLVCALAAGCQRGPKYVPVSGVVTLDGKPYDKAVVMFQPEGTRGNQDPGRGSQADTDAEGKFVLTSDGVRDGAVPGKHLVRIYTRGTHPVESTEGGSPDEYRPSPTADPIPKEWNSMSQVYFEVPPEGTDKANFDIKTTGGN